LRTFLIFLRRVETIRETFGIVMGKRSGGGPENL